MKKIIYILLAMVLLIAGCGKIEQGASQEGGVPEEKRLVIYTAHAKEVYEPLVKEFEERTGIWVEVKDGGARALVREIAEGEEAVCDLFFGGSEELVKEHEELFGAWATVSYTELVLVYNPKLVKNNPPEGWADLLDPVWKGEIAFANPETSGSAYAALNALFKVTPEDADAVRTAFFNNLNDSLLEYSREVVSEVANGNFYIGVTLEETALRSMKEGYDISVVYPQEGENILTDTAAVVAGCAHKENAEAFVEFLQGDEVRQYLVEYLNRHVMPKDAEVTE